MTDHLSWCPQHGGNAASYIAGEIFKPPMPLPGEVLGCLCEEDNINYDSLADKIMDPEGPMSAWHEDGKLQLVLKWDCALTLHGEQWPTWAWMTYLTRIAEKTDRLSFTIIIDMFDYYPITDYTLKVVPVDINKVQPLLANKTLQDRIVLRIAKPTVGTPDEDDLFRIYKETCLTYTNHVQEACPRHCISPMVLIPARVVLDDLVSYRQPAE
jgi:hypothetical protein